MKPRHKGGASRKSPLGGSRVGTPTPWVWGDENDFDGGSGTQPFGVTRVTASRGLTAAASIKATASTPSQVNLAGRSKTTRGALSSPSGESSRTENSQVLNLDGSHFAAVPRMRKKWMRNCAADDLRRYDQRSMSSLSITSVAINTPGSPRSLSPEQLKLHIAHMAPPPKLDLTRAGGGRTEAAAAASKASVADVQPFLGPVLKKALAKQGMLRQRLSVAADEWDTAEVKFMLGAGFASKAEEREAKHLDWYKRKMGPRFVEKMVISAGGKPLEASQHRPVLDAANGRHTLSNVTDSESPVSKAISDAVRGTAVADSRAVAQLMRSGHLARSSVIDTAKLLDMSSLGQGVASVEALPGLQAVRSEVYLQWDTATNDDLSIAELFRARLPPRAGGGGGRGVVKPILAPSARERLHKHSRYLDRSKGDLQLGLSQRSDAGLHLEASVASAADQDKDEWRQGVPGTMSPISRVSSTARSPSLKQLQLQMPGTASRASTPAQGFTLDTSGDPGRGGFLALEMKEQYNRLTIEVMEAEEQWSGSEGTSRATTPWDTRKGVAACSF